MFKNFASVSCIHLSGSGSITYSLSQGQCTGAPCPDTRHTSYSQATPNVGSRFLHTLVFNYKTTQCHTDLSLMWILLWFMALTGAPTSILFPHAETVVFFPQVCSTVEPPPQSSFPLGFRHLFIFFSPLFHIHCIFHNHFHWRFVSPLPFPLLFTNYFSFFFILLLPFPLLFTNYFSFFFILLTFLSSLLCPPCINQKLTSPLVPLYLSLVLRDHTTFLPPLNFSVTKLFIVVISFLP